MKGVFILFFFERRRCSGLYYILPTGEVSRAWGGLGRGDGMVWIDVVDLMFWIDVVD